jgi:hypothetical protein
MPKHKDYGDKPTTTISTRRSTVPIESAIKVVVPEKPKKEPKPLAPSTHTMSLRHKRVQPKNTIIKKTNKNTINASKNEKPNTSKALKEADAKAKKLKGRKKKKADKQKKKQTIDKKTQDVQAKQLKKDTINAKKTQDKQAQVAKEETKKQEKKNKEMAKQLSETKEKKPKKEPKPLAPSTHIMKTRGQGEADPVPEPPKKKPKSTLPIADKVEEAKKKVEEAKKDVEKTEEKKDEKKTETKTETKTEEKKTETKTKPERPKKEKPIKEKPSDLRKFGGQALRGVVQKMAGTQPKEIEKGWKGWIGGGLQASAPALMQTGNPYAMIGGAGAFVLGSLMNMWQGYDDRQREKKRKQKQKYREEINQMDKDRADNEAKLRDKMKHQKQKEKYKMAKAKLKGKEMFWRNEEAKQTKYDMPMKHSLMMLNRRYQAYMAQRDHMLRNIGIMEAERTGREHRAIETTQRDYRRYDIQQNIQKEANPNIFEAQRKKIDEDKKTLELKKVGIDREKLHEGQNTWLQFNAKYVDKETFKPIGLKTMSTQALGKYANKKMEEYSLRNNLKKYVMSPDNIKDTGLRMEDLLGIKYDAYDLEEINKSDVSFVTKPERYITLQQEALKNAEYYKKLWDISLETVKTVGSVASLMNPIKNLVFQGASKFLPTFITKGAHRTANCIGKMKEWYEKVDEAYGADGHLAEWTGESIINWMTGNNLGVNYEKFLAERENNWLKEKYNRKSALETIINGQPYSGKLKNFDKLKCIESRDSFLNALHKLDQYEQQGRLKRETRYVPPWMREEADGSINGKKAVDEITKNLLTMTDNLEEKLKKLKEQNDKQIENIGHNLEKFGIHMNTEFKAVLNSLDSQRKAQYEQAIIQNEEIKKAFSKSKVEIDKMRQDFKKELDEEKKERIKEKIENKEQYMRQLEEDEKRHTDTINTFRNLKQTLDAEREAKVKEAETVNRKIKQKEDEAETYWINLHQALKKKEEEHDENYWNTRIYYSIPDNPHVKKYLELQQLALDKKQLDGWNPSKPYKNFKDYQNYVAQCYQELDTKYKPNFTLEQQSQEWKKLNDFYIWYNHLKTDPDFPKGFKFDRTWGDYNIGIDMGNSEGFATPNHYLVGDKYQPLNIYQKLYKHEKKTTSASTYLLENVIDGAKKHLPSTDELIKIEEKIREVGNDPYLRAQLENYRQTFYNRPEPIIVPRKIEDIKIDDIKRNIGKKPIDSSTLKTFTETIKTIDPNDESGTQNILKDMDDVQKRLAETIHLNPNITDDVLTAFKFSGLETHDNKESETETNRKEKLREKLKIKEKAIDQDVEALDYLYNLITGDLKGDEVFDVNKVNSNDWRSVLFHYYSRRSPLAGDILENANMIGPCIAKDKNGRPKRDSRGRLVYKTVDGRDTSMIQPEKENKEPEIKTRDGPLEPDTMPQPLPQIEKEIEKYEKPKLKQKRPFIELQKRFQQARNYCVLTKEWEGKDPNELYNEIIKSSLFLPKQAWKERYIDSVKQELKGMDYEHTKDGFIALNKMFQNYNELKSLNETTDAQYIEARKGWASTREASQKRLYDTLIEWVNPNFEQDEINASNWNSKRKDLKYWRADKDREYIMQLINTTWHKWGFPDYRSLKKLLDMPEVKACVWDEEHKTSIFSTKFYERYGEQYRLKQYEEALVRAKKFFTVLQHQMAVHNIPIKHSVLLGDYDYLVGHNPMMSNKFDLKNYRDKIMNDNYAFGFYWDDNFVDELPKHVIDIVSKPIYKNEQKEETKKILEASMKLKIPELKKVEYKGEKQNEEQRKQDFIKWLEMEGIQPKELMDEVEERILSDSEKEKVLKDFHNAKTQKEQYKVSVDNSLYNVSHVRNYNIQDFTCANYCADRKRLSQHEFLKLPYEDQVKWMKTKNSKEYYSKWMDNDWEFRPDDEVLAYDINEIIRADLRNKKYKEYKEHPYYKASPLKIIRLLNHRFMDEPDEKVELFPVCETDYHQEVMNKNWRKIDEKLDSSFDEEYRKNREFQNFLVEHNRPTTRFKYGGLTSNLAKFVWNKGRGHNPPRRHVWAYLNEKNEKKPYIEWREHFGEDKEKWAKLVKQGGSFGNVEMVDVGLKKEDIRFGRDVVKGLSLEETLQNNWKNPVSMNYAIAQSKWIKDIFMNYEDEARPFFSNMGCHYLLSFRDLDTIEKMMYDGMYKKDTNFWSYLGQRYQQKAMCSRNYVKAKAVLQDCVKDNPNTKLGRFVDECIVENTIDPLIIHNYDTIMNNQHTPKCLANILEEGGVINTKHLISHNEYPHKLRPDELYEIKPGSRKAIQLHPDEVARLPQNKKDRLVKFESQPDLNFDEIECSENSKDRIVFKSRVYSPDFAYVVPKNRQITIKKRITIDDKIIPKDTNFHKYGRETDTSMSYRVNDFEYTKLETPPVIEEKKEEEVPKKNMPNYSPTLTPYNIPQPVAFEPPNQSNRISNDIHPHSLRDDVQEPNKYVPVYDTNPYGYPREKFYQSPV